MIFPADSYRAIRAECAASVWKPHERFRDLARCIEGLTVHYGGVVMAEQICI